MENINLDDFIKKARCKKFIAFGVVALALLISCAIIIVGCGIYNPNRSIIDKTTVTEKFDKYNLNRSIVDETIVTEKLNNKPINDTVCCKISYNVESTPVIVTETNYNNAVIVLLYVSILVFIILSLWGAFSVLLKTLKYENEVNAKILDVQKDIYKETKMWDLTKQKKELEFEYRKEELKLKKEEFELLEKIKLEMKYKHELQLKEKENKDK